MKYKRIFTTILSFVLLYQVNAQDRLITGKITDTKGNVLAGVNVSAKDYPSITTISGVDGEFRLEIFDFTKALIFAFSSMKTKEVPLDDTDRLLVQMEYLPLKNPNPWSISFNIYTGQSHVYREEVDKDPNWEYSGEPGIKAVLEIEYFITQNIGFATGIGLGRYNSSAFLNGFDNTGENTIARVDQDGDPYYLYNIVSDLTERWKVNTLSIPLKLKFRYRPGKKWSFYGNVGMTFMRTLKAAIKASGSSVWQAYYPDYNVVIYDVPDYGYTSYDVNSEYSLIDYEKSMLSLNASIGVSRRIKKQLSLDFGLYIDRGLTDLKYDQAIHEADFINTVGQVDETILNGIGFMLGIRYQIMKKR